MIITVYCDHTKRERVINQLKNMGIEFLHDQLRSSGSLFVRASEAQKGDIERIPDIQCIAWREEK